MFEETGNAAELARQLSGALYVVFDEERGFVLAWFGGHGINTYNLSGVECFHWNLGDFADDAAPFEEVRQNLWEHVRTGEYLELY